MTRVALLYPGEMGTLVGAAARAEVWWPGAGRSAATRARADAAGFSKGGALAEVVSDADVVLSICPPAVAEDVAAEVATAGFSGLYVEANAISPMRAARIAAALTGARVVDGSIIGGTGLHLYLSGEPADVEQAASLFADTDVIALPLKGGVGAASALKMAFGGWNKIGTALTAQAHAIARAYGVEDALEAEGVESERFVRAARKAWRWAPEMEEIADTCGELGLPDGMGRGAGELFERWSAHRDSPASLERLMDDLLKRPGDTA